MMRIAGYLHDLGKLAVPAEILEKPSDLTKAELNLIRGHTYHTHRILAPLAELNEINTWASFHHSPGLMPAGWKPRRKRRKSIRNLDKALFGIWKWQGSACCQRSHTV